MCNPRGSIQVRRAARGPLPDGGMRPLLHFGLLVNVIQTVLREAGVLGASVVVEAGGLRSTDRTRQ